MNMRSLVAIVALITVNLGCGVKGDPLPPEVPARIGRGQPTYKGALQGIEVREEMTEDELESAKKKENQK